MRNDTVANLRIPGPTPVPPEILEATAGEMINHRGPEFADLLERLTTGIQPFFGTQQEILILSASGTGGMEAAIVNTLSPGDKALCVSVGSFGDRFAAMAEVYGADVTRCGGRMGRRRHAAAGGGSDHAGRLRRATDHAQRNVDRRHQPDRRNRGGGARGRGSADSGGCRVVAGQH